MLLLQPLRFATTSSLAQDIFMQEMAYRLDSVSMMNIFVQATEAFSLSYSSAAPVRLLSSAEQPACSVSTGCRKLSIARD